MLGLLGLNHYENLTGKLKWRKVEMASELFHELYAKAFRLDCPHVHTLNGLTHGLGPGPTTQRIGLAEALYDAGADFIDAIDEYAMKHAQRNREIKLRCPNCGDPYCSGAMPSVRTPMGIVFLQQGAPPNEESGK